MSNVTVSLNDEVEEEVRRVSFEKFKGKKGYLGKAINEALKEWLNEIREEEILKEQFALMNKGIPMKVRYTERGELHER